MTKQELAEALASKLELSKAKAEECINLIVDEITRTLSKGGEVVITGFGKFVVSKRKARQGRNPKTGEVVQIAAKTTPKFRAGKALKDAVK
ncbi:MAG TPA: HU family DNA-binding protein [Candidatus Pacearchaeota archaeon]|jgi:DNA-binding protein HU-beta|nr:HU family DNA-binding protein [Candidatus Parcubacteria bacterium]HNZ83918.1 HU family DNA-binding protein [Candidatus Pacearchaeota archaeon]HOU45690.1 HU family DNA-binding protein [Candidatus Pacearchaeota archaeon]HPM08495.1 HU family DNA-binding protein [Candidatus Pacearchaeota archaeon]HQI74619.1 HU family DNA-binding protein [Candidatus Pacearchaeota archaeon]